ELGWLSMTTPEEHAGMGASFADTAVLFEELGRGPVAGPVFETGVLAPLIMLALGSTQLGGELLGMIGDGEAILTVVLPEHPLFPTTSGSTHVALSVTAGRRQLHGRALFVREAMGASHFLVIAPVDAHGDRLACALVP